MSIPDQKELVRLFYRALYRAWGPQHWWPGRSRFEVIAGAILIQNTSWTNAEQALANLRRESRLSLKGVRGCSLEKLQRLVRPAGYFRQKSRTLKTFAAFVHLRYAGSLTRLFAQPTDKLRKELLGLKGIGPETADSILLYAGQHPVFVVDAYARRVFERHGVISPAARYEEIRLMVEDSLNELATTGAKPEHPQAGYAGPLQAQHAHRPSPMSRARRTPLAQVLNEMHSLLVLVGKQHCLKSHPLCTNCPLEPFLTHDQRIRLAGSDRANLNA